MSNQRRDPLYRYKATETDAAIKDVDIKDRTVTGYLSVFGNKDSHGDIIIPGAFTKTVSERGPASAKPRLVYLRNHMTDAVLGKFTQLKEDGHGLYFEALIADTALGRDTLTLIKEGIMKENSIGYQTINEKYDEEAKANYLTELKLWEGSAVTWGSNELAKITGVKSVVGLIEDYSIEISRIKSVLRNENITDETGYILDIWVKQMQSKLKELIASSEEHRAISIEADPAESSTLEKSLLDDTLDILLVGIDNHVKSRAVNVDSLIHLLTKNP